MREVHVTEHDFHMVAVAQLVKSLQDTLCMLSFGPRLHVIWG